MLESINAVRRRQRRTRLKQTDLEGFALEQHPANDVHSRVTTVRKPAAEHTRKGVSVKARSRRDLLQHAGFGFGGEQGDDDACAERYKAEHQKSRADATAPDRVAKNLRSKNRGKAQPRGAGRRAERANASRV